jgi:hypothetical protein
MAGVVVDIATYYGTYLLCLAAALIVTLVREEATVLLAVVATAFAVFAIAMIATSLALSGRGARAISRRLARVRPVRSALKFLEDADPHLARSPRLLFAAGAWQLSIFVLDAATLWALIAAAGGSASAPAVFASFMISTLLRTVGLLPGGLGVFEAASVLTLRLIGVDVAVALSATLLFRGLSFWLPMLPGLCSPPSVACRGPGRPTPADMVGADPPSSPRPPLEPGRAVDGAGRRLRVHGRNGLRSTSDCPGCACSATSRTRCSRCCCSRRWSPLTGEWVDARSCSRSCSRSRSATRVQRNPPTRCARVNTCDRAATVARSRFPSNAWFRATSFCSPPAASCPRTRSCSTPPTAT